MTDPKNRARPNRAKVLRIAGQASVDPRTVERWLMGLEVRRLSADRLERAVAELDGAKVASNG